MERGIWCGVAVAVGVDVAGGDAVRYGLAQVQG
eukprot:CAMPEP_0194367910 /NCGR_PEP_ID=MMETSP0174-20130528/16095_1 /TAXON_ID=216777 /ORGANISM="Proboscia alata, Strain PI-D3" /LENGTH=32 /DNA_ID= /DNA_START= /DNA_END= /DNA_ORIENTATION=